MALAEVTKLEMIADQVFEDMNETVTSALQMVLNNTLFEHTAVAAAKAIENLGSVDADSLCVKGIMADVLYRHMIARTQGLKDACADAFRCAVPKARTECEAITNLLLVKAPTAAG